MEMFVPDTVRQAKWFIVGGVFAVLMGLVRLMSFFQHGGVMVLLLGGAFLVLGVISVAGAVVRLRRGDPERGRPRTGRA
jgi:uncharacterized membrane protein HdeD (DUF308 family)